MLTLPMSSMSSRTSLPRRSRYATIIFIVVGALIGLFALITLVAIPFTLTSPPDEGFRIIQLAALAAVVIFILVAGVFFTHTAPDPDRRAESRGES